MEVLVEEYVDGRTYQVGLVSTDQERDQCYRLRFQTFCIDIPRLPPENYPDGLEHDEYDRHSWNFIAVDTTRPDKAIGAFRLIRCKHGSLMMESRFSGQPFKLPTEFMGEPVRPETTVEAARWIGPARGTAKKGVIVKVSKMLLEAGLKISLRESITHWICAIDPKPLAHLIKDGWPFEEMLPGTFTHYNETVKVCILNLHDTRAEFGCDHTVDTTMQIRAV